jgi:ketosteroid isomerase-like protein
MSNAQHEVLVRRFLRAYAAKDIHAIRAMFAEDVILRDWNLEVTGRDSAIREFEGNFRQSESIEIKINTIYLSESGVSAEIEILVNETEKLRVVDVVKFDSNQKIVSIVSYKGL